MYLTTSILQTAQHHEVDLSILRALCYQSARLYNASLYSIRQYFFGTNKYLTYNSNWKLIKDTIDYRMLISDSAQQIMRLADRDMQSFFKLLALKKVGKYSEKVRLPRYKDKEGYSVFTVAGRSACIQKDGTLNIGLTKQFREKYNYDCRYIKFTIPKNLRDVKEFKEVRIIPQYGGVQFRVEFIYETSQLPRQAHGDGWLSIDLGIDNLMACTIFSNGGVRQFLIDGKPIKSINHYYNKRMADLKSKRGEAKGNTKRMVRLMNGRSNRISNYFHNAVSYLVGVCLNEGVSHVVVGYNQGWKDEIGIGKVNNQNFTCIPHLLLRRDLEYKCQLHGIEFIAQEESYTSKASCLDLDEIPVYNKEEIVEYKFSGRRVKRGLYRSSEGDRINADINGSVNILRKYFKERKLNWCYQDSVRALVNAPCLRVNPLEANRSPRTLVVGS